MPPAVGHSPPDPRHGSPFSPVSPCNRNVPQGTGIPSLSTLPGM